MFTNTKVTHAVRLALVVGAASTAAFSGAAFAQEQAKKEEAAKYLAKPLLVLLKETTMFRWHGFGCCL